MVTKELVRIIDEYEQVFINFPDLYNNCNFGPVIEVPGNGLYTPIFQY